MRLRLCVLLVLISATASVTTVVAQQKTTLTMSPKGRELMDEHILAGQRGEVKAFGVKINVDDAIIGRVIKTREITDADYRALLGAGDPADSVKSFEASPHAQMSFDIQTGARGYLGGVLREPTFTMMVLIESYDQATGCLIPAAVYFKATDSTRKDDALWVARKTFSTLRGQYAGCRTTGFK